MLSLVSRLTWAYRVIFSKDALEKIISDKLSNDDIKALAIQHLDKAELLTAACNKMGFDSVEELIANWTLRDLNRPEALELMVRSIILRNNPNARHSEVVEDLNLQVFCESVKKVEQEQKNHLKKKSYVLAQIKDLLPGISKSEANLLIELLVQLTKTHRGN